MLVSGTHISNTREAKAFALLQEAIAKGVRRITAVTTECAFKAVELASSFYTEFEDVVKSEASTQEKVYSSCLLSRPLVMCQLWNCGVSEDMLLGCVLREYILSNIESLQKVASLKSGIDAAAIPAATKADLRGNISKLEVFSKLIS
jgi:Threonyl and Alanyl tRNA synthetase second additional domain